MKEKDDLLMGLVWRAMDRPVVIRFGDGTAMIGAAHNGSEVGISFYAYNGMDEPQEIGAVLSGKEERAKVKADMIAVFRNRESLEVLAKAVDHARTLFDKLPPKGTAA